MIETWQPALLRMPGANQLVHDQRAVGHVLQRKFYAEFFRDTNGGQDVVRLMRVRL